MVQLRAFHLHNDVISKLKIASEAVQLLLVYVSERQLLGNRTSFTFSKVLDVSENLVSAAVGTLSRKQGLQSLL